MQLHKLTPTVMKKNSTKINWLAMGNDLIECLRSKGNHRLSRYDAFVWMIEHVQHGTIITNDLGVVVDRTPFTSDRKSVV